MPGYCSKCGKGLQEGDAFCPSCGSAISIVDSPDKDRARCPECGSTSMLATKRRHRSRKVRIHCLKCGHRWSVKKVRIHSLRWPVAVKVSLVLLVAYALLMCILIATGVIEKNGNHNVTPKKSMKTLKNSR